ncbi:uncharacterized protein JN550_010418 [Neoarthrinium moseri]|uniref:uncharacterized protein n=1 Tax=Neoarthrinium moseri TaxID=1658444 RepID=UPI001FDC7C03|nr:uncharacterized protein JN550_010418 [Neoarthrinium moseri]KAI1862115.1 hypothetical protein JN550_010418 [Neoarthrinium moseri]
MPTANLEQSTRHNSDNDSLGNLLRPNISILSYQRPNIRLDREPQPHRPITPPSSHDSLSLPPPSVTGQPQTTVGVVAQGKPSRSRNLTEILDEVVEASSRQDTARLVDLDLIAEALAGQGLHAASQSPLPARARYIGDQVPDTRRALTPQQPILDRCAVQGTRPRVLGRITAAIRPRSSNHRALQFAAKHRAVHVADTWASRRRVCIFLDRPSICQRLQTKARLSTHAPEQLSLTGTSVPSSNPTCPSAALATNPALSHAILPQKRRHLLSRVFLLRLLLAPPSQQVEVLIGTRPIPIHYGELVRWSPGYSTRRPPTPSQSYIRDFLPPSTPASAKPSHPWTHTHPLGSGHIDSSVSSGGHLLAQAFPFGALVSASAAPGFPPPSRA